MTQERMHPDAPFMYAQYVASGWTDDQLIAEGLLRPETSLAAVEIDDRLRLLIERIERLEAEKKGIADDIRDVYSEGKAVGYDTKMIREIIKLRAMAPDDRREREQLLEVYKAALGLA